MFKKLLTISTLAIITTCTLGCTNVDNQEDVIIAQVKLSQPKTQRVTVHEAIKKYAKEFNVDEKTIHAIVKTESNYNPKAVSSSNAQGLMQLLPSTGKARGCTNLFDIHQNIRCGTKHYAGLLARYNGNEDLALSAYNCGGGCVDRYKGKVPPFTQGYVNKVKANRNTIILD